MKRISILLLAAFVLTSCADLKGAKNKKVETKVVKKYSEEEAKTVKLEKADYKTWIFEQRVLIRVGTDPSSKIVKAVEEGDSVKAAIVSLGNGWSRISIEDGPEGFYFGKTLAREKK